MVSICLKDANADGSGGADASPAVGLKALGPVASTGIGVKALGSVHDVAIMR